MGFQATVNSHCEVKIAHHFIKIIEGMTEDIIVWWSFLSQFNGILILQVNNHDLQLLTDAFKGKRLKEAIPGELGMVRHDASVWV